MSDADVLIALTSIEADGLRQRGAAPPRVSVIGAGLDPLPPTSDGQKARAILGLTQPFVLFIGRASYDKGALHAAQAVLALHRQSIAVNLVLVGSISAEFERFHNSLTTEEKQIIRPAGILDETTKHALLDEAEMLMLPSRTDSFGIVLLEAWAHGKAVVAARAGGIPGVVDDGENGFLVNFGDVKSMTEAVRLLLVDQSLSQRMGEDGRLKVITQYNWELICDRVLDVYETVLRHL
jgi:glycosyltransferase involved in cell wall biosynthesis